MVSKAVSVSYRYTILNVVSYRYQYRMQKACIAQQYPPHTPQTPPRPPFCEKSKTDSATRLWFPTKLLDRITQTIYQLKANAQTYHSKSFWTHQGVILDPQIAKNKVVQDKMDTLYLR